MIKRNEKGELVESPHIVDRTGERHGRLVVLGIDLEKATRKTFWRCKCDCGNEKTVRSDSLGSTISCGCLKKEQDFNNLHLERKQLHGLTNHPVYPRWDAMMNRCYNPKSESYKNYGARGIKVCNEWHTFKNFAEWTDNSGFKPELSIERIDLNKGYSPENCTWITLQEQHFNKTNNVWHEYKGERKTTMQWAKELKIPLHIVSRYKRKGQNFLDIIEEHKTTPR